MTSYGLSGKEFYAVLCCHNQKIQRDTIFDVSILYFIAALIFFVIKIPLGWIMITNFI